MHSSNRIVTAINAEQQTSSSRIHQGRGSFTRTEPIHGLHIRLVVEGLEYLGRGGEDGLQGGVGDGHVDKEHGVVVDQCRVRYLNLCVGGGGKYVYTYMMVYVYLHT